LNKQACYCIPFKSRLIDSGRSEGPSAHQDDIYATRHGCHRICSCIALRCWWSHSQLPQSWGL